MYYYEPYQHTGQTVSASVPFPSRDFLRDTPMTMISFPGFSSTAPPPACSTNQINHLFHDGRES
jgi:hypothetical protein